MLRRERTAGKVPGPAAWSLIHNFYDQMYEIGYVRPALRLEFPKPSLEGSKKLNIFVIINRNKNYFVMGRKNEIISFSIL